MSFLVKIENIAGTVQYDDADRRTMRYYLIEKIIRRQFHIRDNISKQLDSGRYV